MTEQDTRISTERQRVPLHGREVAFRELPGTGTPLLLVHGIGSSADTWGDIPERLSALGHHVVAVDLCGHGESSKGPGDYSLGSLASTLRDLLDDRGLDRVHLVGHSLGGGDDRIAFLVPEVERQREARRGFVDGRHDHLRVHRSRLVASRPGIPERA